jgi:hypothetical protein
LGSPPVSPTPSVSPSMVSSIAPPPPPPPPPRHRSNSRQNMLQNDKRRESLKAPIPPPPKVGLSLSLLQDIRGGTQPNLRSTAVAENPQERVVDLRGGLLSAIKAGTQLKTVVNTKPTPAKGGGAMGGFMVSNSYIYFCFHYY